MDAAVHQNAHIQALGGDGLGVTADQGENLLAIAVSGAGGNSAGVAGSVVVDVQTNTTTAHIDPNATVDGPSAGASVAANDATSILSIAGALAIGGTAGVGAGVDVEDVSKDTEAWIGNKAHVTTSGTVTVDATSSEDVTSIAVGGGFGGTAAVNVNVGVSVFTITTKAFIDGGPLATDGAVVNAGGSVGVSANERLSLDVIGGNISASGTAAVGAAAAVPVVTKETHAYIGDHAHVNARGGSGVSADTGSVSLQGVDTHFDPSSGVIEGDGSTLNLGFTHGLTEDERVVYDNGGASDIVGLTSLETDANRVYYVHKVSDTEIQLMTTPGGHASGGKLTCPTAGLVCGLSAPSTHGELHRIVPTDKAGVREDQSPRFNPGSTTDLALGSNTITLPYDLGANTGDKVVYSSGGGDPIGGLVDGGTYYAIISTSGNPTVLQLADSKCHATGSSDDCGGSPGTVTAIDLTSRGSGRAHSIVKDGQAPTGDSTEAGPRTLIVGTDTVAGVAVTATNSDDIAGVGVSAGFAGSAAVNLSATSTSSTSTRPLTSASRRRSTAATRAARATWAHPPPISPSVWRPATRSTRSASLRPSRLPARQASASASASTS